MRPERRGDSTRQRRESLEKNFVLLIGKLSKAADKCPAQGYIEVNLCGLFFLVRFVQLHCVKVASRKKKKDKTSVNCIDITRINAF